MRWFNYLSVLCWIKWDNALVTLPEPRRSRSRMKYILHNATALLLATDGEQSLYYCLTMSIMHSRLCKSKASRETTAVSTGWTSSARRNVHTGINIEDSWQKLIFNRNNRQILELKLAIPTEKITAPRIATIFFADWVMLYRYLSYLLTNNEPQFVGKLLMTLCTFIGLKTCWLSSINPKVMGRLSNTAGQSWQDSNITGQRTNAAGTSKHIPWPMHTVFK